MDTTTFDGITRTLGRRLSRRAALRGLAASAGALVAGGALLPAEEASAKKGRKTKNKGKKPQQPVQPPPNPAPVGAVVTCPNINTPCGLGTNTLICRCTLTKEGTQNCVNFINPPNGAAFAACQQTANCPAGQVCDVIGNVCRSTCQTG